MADPFASARLIYRSIDPKTDLPFFLALASDPTAEMAVNPNLPKVRCVVLCLRSFLHPLNRTLRCLIRMLRCIT